MDSRANEERAMMKKGFTIVELLMVIGIIGVLLGLVTTAASSSVKMSRLRKSEALCSLVQTGLHTYYAQKGEWPIDFEGKSSNAVDADGYKDEDTYVLTGSEVRDCVKALVMEYKQNQNPLIDISGLFVSRSTGETNTRGFGLDFFQAVHGVREKSNNKMKLAEMYFGYPETTHGWFRRFCMKYSFPSDSITVYRW